MATSSAALDHHGKVPSLAEQAEQKILEELSNHIQNESKQSIFAIGGSIPITSLHNHLICESDDTASDRGSLVSGKASKGSGTENDPMVVEISDCEESESRRPEDTVNEYSEFPDREDLQQAESSGKRPTHKMRCDPVTLRWDSSVDPSASHKVTLPCADKERPAFEQLLKDCEPATFGRGGKDVMDETYRKAGKMDESAFSTNFNPYALGIIETAAQALVPNYSRQTNETRGIRAALYKLNVRIPCPTMSAVAHPSSLRYIPRLLAGSKPTSTLRARSTRSARSLSVSQVSTKVGSLCCVIKAARLFSTGLASMPPIQFSGLLSTATASMKSWRSPPVNE